MNRAANLVSGVSWGGASAIAVAAFQLVFLAVMARLLNPADFGIVAIANIGLRFLSYFAQLGVGPAIVQKPGIDKGDIGAAFAVSVGISAFVLLVAMVSAPLMEMFFAMKGLAPVARALALNFVLVGLSAVPLGLLRRSLRFKAIALIDAFSYVCGYGLVGVLCARLGAGAWALVAASIAQNLLSLTGSIYAARNELEFLHSPRQRRHFFSFGSKYSLIGFVEFLSANVDAMVVGKLFGQAASGFYSRATLLANLPVQQPVNVLTRVLFPIMSRSARQASLKTEFQLGVLVVGTYAFACGFGIAVTAPEIVACLLGDKWRPVTPALQVLALSVGPMFVSHLAGVTLDSMGALSQKLRVQSIVLAVLVLAVALGLRVGIAGIAASVVIAEFLRLVLLIRLIGKQQRISTNNWVSIFGLIAVLSVGPALAAYVTSMAVRPSLTTWSSLVAEVSAGLLTFGSLGLFGWTVCSRAHSVKLIALHLPTIRSLTFRSRTGADA